MRETGVVVPMEASVGVDTISSPLWIDSEEKRIPQRAPEIGEHTDQILREYGVRLQRRGHRAAALGRCGSMRRIHDEGRCDES